ncbi:MAG: pyridoxal phosphate-dependent aminotransferase [Methanoregula sp.]
MIPKAYLRAIFRTPVDRTPRASYIRLDKNEWTVPIPKKVLDQIKNEISADFLSCYPEVYKLYDALAEFHSLSVDHFLPAAGSDGAIRATFDAFVSPGDEIINIQPNFAMYSVYAKLYQAKEIGVFYHPEKLTLDVDDVIQKITRKTRLIIHSNPNSPAGVLISNDQIRQILDAASEHNTGVLVDEAYFPNSDSTSLDLLKDYPNLLIMRSFSKAFGLASARVGYAIGNPESIELLAKFKPMYEVNALGVVCCTTLLNHYSIVEKTVRQLLKNKKEFVRNVEGLGLTVLPSGTNFVNIVVGQKKIKPLIDTFEKAGILIRPGYDYGILKECIRISIGDEQAMEKVLTILEKDGYSS